MKKFCSLCNRNLIDVKEKYCSSYKDKLSKRHSIYKKDRKDIIAQKFYSFIEWINKRDIIKNLDNNLCLEHRELNNMDTVHHIKKLKEDWSKRLEKDNLISLCENCHQKIHRKYLMSKEEKLKT